MHELPLLKTIFKTVNEYAIDNKAKRVTQVHLKLGVLREFVPELVFKYWNYVTKDTIAEGSKLVVEEIPAAAKCSQCGMVYVIDIDHMDEAKCPQCGYEKGYLISGREIILDSISIE